MVNAIAFSLEAGVPASHLLYGHDGKVTQGVSQDVEVGRYWLLSSLVLDVTAVSIEADLEGVLCFSRILLLASPALYEVDDIARLAGGCSSYMEGLVSGGTLKCFPSLNVLACEAPSVATRAAAEVQLTVG